MTTAAASPSSTGPAGAHFEGEVGAHYLLSLLASTAPRGLPGTAIDRIECQRAAEGRALDDIIIHAHDAQGRSAVLEIQVKRSITFAPADTVFRDVVSQLAKASNHTDFWTFRYELAVATAQTSRKISGPIQDVLTWARQLGDANTFFSRIERRGSANDEMRAFVHAFRAHLLQFGYADDNDRIWQLMRRFQVLVFDFNAEGSQSRELATERAVRVLHPDDGPRAEGLWTGLVEHAIGIAASGGDTTLDRVRQHLQLQGFRFRGDRRWVATRAALAEEAQAALADIGDRIGSVALSRHERTALIHAALDTARYVEIRGDAGVGKSAILKHVAQQIAIEAPIIVLRPGRTTPRGLGAMRGQLQFDGTGHELLSDLAADGGAILFVDNLNEFGDEERTTICDLVREAAKIAGVSVVATTRLNAGFEEIDWLPNDALARLGRADPVMLGELSPAEVAELRETAPDLAPLLAELHPARGVARNLFRLSRLASRATDSPMPRTEVDMAEQWWQSADGRADGGLRERSRVLKAIAEQALARAEPFDVAPLPAVAIDTLVASQTLRNTGPDRVAFWHDVLREWAIGNLLHDEQAALDRLPVDRPASAALARGVELLARMTLERSKDGERWDALLERLSKTEIHGSWRRAVLLAVVRSEVGPELLTRAGLTLLRDGGAVLRELIRLIIAVDTQPFSELLSVAGIDPATIPAGLFVPNGPSWYRLVTWLLLLGDSIPPAAISEVVDLYTKWSAGMLGRDAITPLLLKQMYLWLTEIETACHPDDYRNQRQPFGGGIDYERLGSLESALRMGFLLFCNRTPELASEYLKSLRGRDDERNLLKFRGSLAQAAPKELADFTAAALIPDPENTERMSSRQFEEPFSFIDHDLFPASPAQGPFYEILTQEPDTGLSLIRRLIDHAIVFYTRGRGHGSDAITLAFPAGDQVFPWIRSYAWSREGSQHNGLTCGLMALEGWGHRRIEAGDNIQAVLQDVLGSPDSPAAYLLVAVDLLISHWPKTREAIIPFLACPELVCLDRERQINDNLEYPNVFGMPSPREPTGQVTLIGLKKRPSRQHALDELLHRYAFNATGLRELLAEQLHRACIRLGEPKEGADLGDPAFMAYHALNLIDPDNWVETSVVGADGNPIAGKQYRSPPVEARRIEAVQGAAQKGLREANLTARIGLALEDPSKSSPELATVAVQWAQDSARDTSGGESDEESVREHQIATAALITVRDGTQAMRAQHADWARGVFARALQSDDDPGFRIRPGLRYNPVAIAFVGTVYLLRHDAKDGDLRLLLDFATCVHSGAAHGFNVVAPIIAEIDERWLRALLRCALASSLRWRRMPGRTDEDETQRVKMQRSHAHAAIDAELAWLSGDRDEPDWPVFPSEPATTKHRIRLPGGPPERTKQRKNPTEQYVDHQGAALWISCTRSIADIRARPWLRDVVKAYGPWTASANGAGLERHEDVAHPPFEWNSAYFKLVANCLPGLCAEAVDSLALTPITSLPNESFYNVVADFQHSVDEVYFSDLDLAQPIALRVRSLLANHMMQTRGWTYQAGRSSTSIEVHLGPAVATLFFNDYGFARPPACYLLPPGVDKLEVFLPILTKLVEAGPCFFVAIVTLNVLEVAPRHSHLSLFLAAATTWLRVFPDNIDFWVDQGIGGRVSKLIQAHLQLDNQLLDPRHALRPDIDQCLDQLVRLGVVEARRTEQVLAGGASR